MTQASRMPAIISGTASGSSTRTQALAARVAHPLGRLEDVGRDRRGTRRDVAEEDEQRVGRQRDDRRDQRQPEDRPQDGERRQARDRVQQAGDGRDRAVDPRLADDPDRQDQRDHEPEERAGSDRQHGGAGRSASRSSSRWSAIQPKSMSGLCPAACSAACSQPRSARRARPSPGRRRRRPRPAARRRRSNAGACSPSRIMLGDRLDGQEPLDGRRSRSTTMPAWTSASSIIESASLRVVRLLTDGETGLAIVGGERAARREAVVGDPAERPRSPSSTSEEVAERRLGAPRRARRRGVVADRGRSAGCELQVADPAAGHSRLRPRSCADEAGDELGRRAGQDLEPAVPNWARIAAGLEDRDEVAHLDRLVDVVGHEQDRLGDLSWSRRNSFWSRSRTIGSTAPNGSSMSMIGGSAASARATPTRWRSPPDSWLGKRSRYFAGSRPTRPSSSSDARPLARLRPAQQARHGRRRSRRSSGAGTGRPAG